MFVCYCLAFAFQAAADGRRLPSRQFGTCGARVLCLLISHCFVALLGLFLLSPVSRTARCADLTDARRGVAVGRASFPHSQQLHCLFRFLLDQTQTPNTKVKVNTLRYMRSVLDAMDAASFPAEDPDLPLAVTKVRRRRTLEDGVWRGLVGVEMCVMM